MELRHLRYFIALADLLSFTRAASALRLTQPALSRQVRDLENELGVPLVQRLTHGIRLTPAGTTFAQRAREIVAAAERAAEEARSTGKQIRFGHYGTLWLDFFAPALRQFAKQHPSQSLFPLELTPSELQQAVRTGEVDFALLGPRAETNPDELVIRRVAEIPSAVVMAAANPLGKRRRLPLTELRDATWLRWDEKVLPGRNRLLVDAARTAGFSPRWGATVDSIGSVFMQVAHSAAVALVLPMSRKSAIPGLVFSELKGAPVKFPMDVAWRANHPFSDALQHLADLLAEVGRR